MDVVIVLVVSSWWKNSKKIQKEKEMGRSGLDNQPWATLAFPFGISA